MIAFPLSPFKTKVMRLEDETFLGQGNQIYQSMANRTRATKSNSKTPRISDGTGPFSLGIQMLALRRPRTAQFEVKVTPRSLKEPKKLVSLPACRPNSGIMNIRENSRRLTKPLQQIDVVEYEDDNDDDDDDEEDDDEEEIVLPDCTSNRPVTAPVCVAGGWTRGLMCPSQRDEFEVPNLEDLRLEIPDTICKAWEDIAEENEEIRIILVGKRNSGKTATANTILGYSAFDNSHVTLTKTCRYGTCQRFDRRLVVVDTPDVCNHDNKTELLKAIALTSPGPHVFIFVVGIGNINKSDEETYYNLVKMFGNDVPHYMIILFTRKDDLVFEGMTIFGYVNEVPDQIKNALTACNRRYVAFDNHCTGRESEVQVRKLLDVIDNILILNRGHFTNQVFVQTEIQLKIRSECIAKSYREKYIERVGNLKNEAINQENDTRRAWDDDGNKTANEYYTFLDSEDVDYPGKYKNDTDKTDKSKQRPKSSSGCKRRYQKRRYKLQRFRQKTARTPSLSPIESVECDSESEVTDVGYFDIGLSQNEVILNKWKEELKKETEKNQLREKIRMELEHDVDEVYRLLKKVNLPTFVRGTASQIKTRIK